MRVPTKDMSEVEMGPKPQLYAGFPRFRAHLDCRQQIRPLYCAVGRDAVEANSRTLQHKSMFDTMSLNVLQ